LRIEAEILPDGVRFHERGFLRSYETKIPFEAISDQVTRVFHVSRLYLFITAFFAFLLAFRLYGFIVSDEVSLGSLGLSLLFFLLAAGGTWMQSPRYVGFAKTGPFFFAAGRKADPTAFIEQIKQARGAYLRARFLAQQAAVDAPRRGGIVN
jgi:hypothetical protein